MESWFHQPDSDRLPLSNDQWVLVRRRLNTGEQRAHFQRSSPQAPDGMRHFDSLEHGLSLVASHLLDWSLVDTQGQPVAIQGFEPDTLILVVDNLDPDRFIEIKDAIVAHVAAKAKERAVQKKTAGTMTSSATSGSPDTSTGRTNTSRRSTRTSTP